MTYNHIRLATAGAFAGLGLTALAIAMPAAAAPSYDGLWSVLIVTEHGDCDRAYRYPVRIQGGALANAGDSPINISGKVGGNGSVTVTVSYGQKSAMGSGRLSGTSGGGSWKGGACTGTWEAERRG
jgi:hypothetical protein